MSRVIFLDVDGVLNTTEDRSIKLDAVKNLSLLVKHTGAEIILHSGWRFWFDDDMRPLREEAEQLEIVLLEDGISLSEKTPDLSDDEIRRTEAFSKVKASEILSWLNEHKTVINWVVLDDLDLHNTLIADHQVMPDPIYGLTRNDIEIARKIMNLS